MFCFVTSIPEYHRFRTEMQSMFSQSKALSIWLVDTSHNSRMDHLNNLPCQNVPPPSKVHHKNMLNSYDFPCSSGFRMFKNSMSTCKDVHTSYKATQLKPKHCSKLSDQIFRNINEYTWKYLKYMSSFISSLQCIKHFSFLFSRIENSSRCR